MFLCISNAQVREVFKNRLTVVHPSAYLYSLFVIAFNFAGPFYLLETNMYIWSLTRHRLMSLTERQYSLHQIGILEKEDAVPACKKYPCGQIFSTSHLQG